MRSDAKLCFEEPSEVRSRETAVASHVGKGQVLVVVGRYQLYGGLQGRDPLLEHGVFGEASCDSGNTDYVSVEVSDRELCSCEPVVGAVDIMDKLDHVS